MGIVLQTALGLPCVALTTPPIPLLSPSLYVGLLLSPAIHVPAFLFSLFTFSFLFRVGDAKLQHALSVAGNPKSEVPCHLPI